LGRELQSLPPDITPEPIFVASPENTIIAKLIWFDKGNRVSERQWGDVRPIIEDQGSNLDFHYLRSWGRTLGVSELLDKAVAQSSRGPTERGP
jgi:hypothetical protein